MKFSPKQYAISLYETLEESKTEEAQKIYQSFIRLLVKNNDLGLSSKIYEELNDYLREQKNEALVEVKTAVPFESDQRIQLIEVLKKYTKKEIELVEKIDQQILGGAILKIRDRLIDGSTKTQLLHLKKNLIK